MHPTLTLRDLLLLLSDTASRGASEPRWRLQTALQTFARLFVDRAALEAAGSALRACGRPDTASGRLRFAWTRSFEAESHWLLGVQANRITPAWADRSVDLVGTLPPAGSVLVCPHHLNQRLGFLRLAEQCDLAIVLNNVEVPTDGASAAVGWVAANRQQVGALYRRIFAGRVFSGPSAARAAVRHLRAGGNVVILPDLYEAQAVPETGSILGRQLPLAPGPTWIAARANAPLIPWVLLPFRAGRWRLWLGSAIQTTKQALEQAIGNAISRSPANWMFWTAWLNAPLSLAAGAMP